MRKFYANCLKVFTLIALLVPGINGLAQNLGFEAASASPPATWTATSGTWNTNTTASFVRTGSQSMTIAAAATTGSTIGNTSGFVTTASAGNYLITIGWGKASTATNGLFYLGYRSGTTNTLNPAATATGQPSNLNDVTWSRITSVSSATVAAGTYSPSLRAFRTASATTTAVYIDDIIIYASTSNVVDLSAPNAPTGGSITGGNNLSWTNGADNGSPASGIGGVVIIRADGAGQTAPTLNDQAMYNPTNGAAGVGSFSSSGVTWTVVGNISGSSTTSFTDASAGAGPYTYVVYMRDLAYNYSPGLVMGAATACIDPPTPGNANVTPSATQCQGTSRSLSLTGHSTGTGQTYRWLSSSSALGTYTYVSASSSSVALSVSPTVTTWYKAEVTCNGNSQLSAPVEVLVTSYMHGSYTIDPSQPVSSTNWQTFTTAINAMACGIDGPVEFQVAPGTYNEQITISPVTGASATNRVTFKGNLATLSFTGVTGTRHGIVLNGADYITIDSLIIDGTAGTFGWGILLTGQADYNVISNCNIKVSKTVTTSNNTEGVVISGSLTSAVTSGNNGNNNTIIGNTITGGQYGVVLYGSSTAGAQNVNNIVKDNFIQDTYDNSIHVLYQSGAVISGNDISRPTRSGVTAAGAIFLSTGDVGCLVEKNRIHNMFDAAATSTSTFYGIYVAADGTAGQPNRLINNLIYNTGGNGITYGIYNTTAPYTYSYHNTIALNDQAATSGATYGFYQTGASAGIDIRNNIVYITRSGTGLKRALFFNTPGSTITSNKNVLFVSTGTDVGIGALAGDNSETLADWQLVNNGGIFYDQQSVSVDPFFSNPGAGDYTPTEPSINNIGFNLSIAQDITGAARTATPDPGAYEFSLPPCIGSPTAGSAVASNLNACSGATFTLDLINNTTGDGQTYQWQSSPDGTTWANLGSASSASLFATTQTVSTYYQALVQCNSGPVVASVNVYVTTPGLVSGNFTIDAGQPTGGSNFQTFAEAINHIKCGINGPVVFDVAPNSFYTEQVVIPVIPGTSAVNRVTFNGNGAILQYTVSTSAKRAAVILNGADYITIDSLTIDVSAGTYGWGVVMMNQADNNIIRKCTINNNTSSTATNYLGIAINGTATGTAGSGNNGNNNQILNNTITGGYYGIYLYGASATPNSNNIVSGNIIKENYLYSIYLIYQAGAVLSKNDISKPTRTFASATVTTYGIYVSTGVVGLLAEKNSIHHMLAANPGHTGTFYSFYMSADGTAAQPNKLQNNLIYNIGGNGPVYGIYNTTSPYMYAYHNTIALNDQAATTGTAYGFYQTGASAGIDFRNNIVSITRSGTGIKRVLYFATTTSTITSNYNVLYMGSSLAGADNNLGQFGTTNYSTLANWKTANTNAYDQNSVSEDPMYFDPANGDFQPTSPFFDNLAPLIAGVTTDIRDSVRNASADPGAYEFSVSGDFIAPFISYTPLTYTCATADRTLTGVTINDVGGVPTTGTLRPRIYYKKITEATWHSNAGTLTGGTGNTGTWSFTILNADMGGVSPNDSIQYFITAQDNTGNISSNPAGLVAADVNNVTTYPTPNFYRIASLSGTFTVGTGGNYPTLAAAVDAYNTSCLTGAVAFELLNGTHTLSAVLTINRHTDASVVNTLTIRPAAGATVNLTGTIASSPVLRILGKYVTINGSNNGSTSRDLTISNTNTTGPSVLFIGSNGTSPITDVVVKNTVIVNGSSASSAVIIRDASGGTGYYNNITLQNNNIQKAYYAIYSAATITGTNGSGLNIIDNDLSTSGTNGIRYGGVYVFGANGATISNNTIGNFEIVNGEIDKGLFIDATSNTTVSGNTILNLGYSGTGAFAPYGIYINQTNTNVNVNSNIISGLTASGTMAPAGVYVVNSNISGTIIQKNRISNVKNTNTAGYGAYGIWLSSSSTAANTSVRNNFIWDVAGYGSATGLNNGAGISITAGAGYGIYHNTVLMNTNQTAVAGLPSALYIGSSITAAGAVNVRSNLFANTQTSGTERYAIYSAAANTVFAAIDYNDYWTAGPNLGYIGSNRSNLAAIATGFGGNANSVNVQPVFASATDLHIDPPTNLALDNKGTVISGITTDIDGDTRSGTTPDVGADEFTSTAGLEVGVKAMLLPGTKICYTNAETLTVTIRNFSASIHDFAVNPVTINASATGPNAVTFPAVIVNTGTLNPGDTLNVVITNSYNMSAAGTYTFNAATSIAGDANTSNDAMSAVTRNVVALSAGTAATSRDSYCLSGGIPTLSLSGGSGINAIQWQESSSSSGPWNNVGTNTNTYTPASAITATTYYRAVASCGLNTANSNLITVELINPAILTSSPASVCNGGSVSLGATTTPGYVLNWYDASTGGTPIATGNTFNTPYLSSTTDYYVAASSGGVESNVGMVSPPGNTGTSGAGQNTYGLYFDALSPFTLKSVVVYPIHATPGTSGSVTIAVINSGGTILHQATVNVTGYPTSAIVAQTVNLNFDIAPGTGYRLVPMNRTGVTGLLFQPSASAPGGNYGYPFTVPGVVSITSGTYTGNVFLDLYYYFYNWTISTGCEGPRTTVTATVNPVNGIAGAVSTSECGSMNIAASTESAYFTDCGLITTLSPTGASPIAGSVNACVTIDASVQTAPTGEPYVQRHYNITPASNPTTATSTITLYFLQSEFDAFNAASGFYAKLPTGSADATGKANLRITQYNGTGTAPGNYTGTASQINPADPNISWNSIAGRWEVSFNVTGAGGFYVHTGLFVLPVTGLELRGVQSGAMNRLSWGTVTETNSKGFELQRGADGKNFSSIAFVATKAEGGSSALPLSYIYNDEKPLNGNNYYRLKQVDKDGKFSYSNVVLLGRKVSDIILTSVYPNPAEKELNVMITSPRTEKITIIITDLSGKVVMQRPIQLLSGENQQVLKVQSLAAGTYLIKAVCANGCETAVQRFVKQ